jgi:hypothetical protein
MPLTTADNDIKAILSEIIADLNSSQKIDLEMLNNWEDKLEEILPMFWFDLRQAKESENWALVSELRTATKECQATLDQVRVAIFQQIGVIPVDNSEIAQMNHIRQEIQQALKREIILRGVIRLVVLLRKLIFV